MGTTPRIKPYKITAVFEIGMSEYDASFVFMPLTEAQAYFNRTNDVTAIEVFTTNPDKIDGFRKSVTRSGGQACLPGRLATAQLDLLQCAPGRTQRDVPDFDDDCAGRSAQYRLRPASCWLKDKGSDIAILRTMGPQGSIMRIFLITGAAIGVVGTLTGFLVGMLICLNIEWIRQFLSWLTNTELFSPELHFLSELPAESISARPARS